MLMIEAGTKNGEILRGLIAAGYALCSLDRRRPPMPAPVITPQRSRSIFARSSPLSVKACMPAAMP
jgi:hypothetical protein